MIDYRMLNFLIGMWVPTTAILTVALMKYLVSKRRN